MVQVQREKLQREKLQCQFMIGIVQDRDRRRKALHILYRHVLLHCFDVTYTVYHMISILNLVQFRIPSKLNRIQQLQRRRPSSTINNTHPQPPQTGDVGNRTIPGL